MIKSAWNVLADGAKSLNRIFPIVGPEKKREERLELSEKEVSEAYREICSMSKGIADCKVRLAEAGRKEPFRNEPDFLDDKNVIATFRVPKILCEGALGGFWTEIVYSRYDDTEREQGLSDYIGMTLGAAVGVLDEVYGEHAQELLTGVLGRDVFYQAYETSRNKENFQGVMGQLIELSQEQKSGRCPEAILSKLCDSMVIAAMLRDAEPHSAAYLLRRMFNQYEPEESVDIIKQARVFGMLKPSKELATFLHQYKMTDEFVEAVMENSGHMIKPDKEVACEKSMEAHMG